MKLFVLASAAIATEVSNGQCGTTDIENFEKKCGIPYHTISPPTCEDDEVCYSPNGCYWACIKPQQCQDHLYYSLSQDGKRLCNCEKEPSFDYSWTCDFVDQQHGRASMPPINRNYAWDDRKFTLLEGTRIDQYHSLMADDNSYIHNFFQTSPCEGVLTDNNGTPSVNFNDIFNNEQCMPKCTTITGEDGVFKEQCEIVLGYDDLLLPLSESNDPDQATFARGTSWELTCYRTLEGQVVDMGSVKDDRGDVTKGENEIRTNFNMLIACCDPEKEDCDDPCTETPVIQIGPYAEQKNFFVQMDFEYGSKRVNDRGYLHIESCVFEEVDANNNIINGPLELIHDGCPTEFGRVSFIENMEARSSEYSYREQMELLPFKLDRAADYFKLTCDLLACPWYAVYNNLCKLKDTCSLSDRYDPLITYAENNVSRRRRRSSYDGTSMPPKEVITETLKHPCTTIQNQDDTFCVEGEGCWTYQLCQDRRTTEEESSAAVGMTAMSALFAAMFL